MQRSTGFCARRTEAPGSLRTRVAGAGVVSSAWRPFPSPRHLEYTPQTMSESFQVYLAKAEESLLGAASELDGGRYNNSANRAYYACFVRRESAV